MACNGFGIPRILKPMGFIHIGGIRGYHIKRSQCKQLAGLHYIAGDNVHLAFQMIICHAPSGHVRGLFLYLQAGKVASLCLGGKKNRNDACACSQVQHLFPLFHNGKAGQKDGIHAEAECALPLDDSIMVALQIIDPLVVPQHNGSFLTPSVFHRNCISCHPASTFLPSFQGLPAA